MRLHLLFLLCASLSAQAFEIVTFNENVPESNPVKRTRVTDGGVRFSFVTPDGWMAAPEKQARRVLMRMPGKGPLITISISTNAMPANLARLKEQVTAKFENATITESFQAAAGDAPGMGVDVRHVLNGRIPVTTRYCVFKAANGAVEVSLAGTQTDWNDEVHWAWTGFINSFRVEALGEEPKGRDLQAGR